MTDEELRTAALLVVDDLIDTALDMDYDDVRMILFEVGQLTSDTSISEVQEEARGILRFLADRTESYYER